MVRRRRASRRKAPRQFGINVIETGAALALLEQTSAGSAMKSFIAGDLNAGLTTLSKSAIKSFSRGSPILASLGPIKVRA
jgi:hypothetical protein